MITMTTPAVASNKINTRGCSREQKIWLLFNTSIDCNLPSSLPILGTARLPDGLVYSIYFIHSLSLAGFCITRGRLHMIGRDTGWVVFLATYQVPALFCVIYGCIFWYGVYIFCYALDTCLFVSIWVGNYPSTLFFWVNLHPTRQLSIPDT